MKIPGRAILAAPGSGTSHMVFSGSRVFNGLSSLRDNFLSWNRSRLTWSCLTEAWQLSLHLLHVVKLWKLKKNSILSFSKTFYFDTLSVYFGFSVGPFLLELKYVYVADGINNPYNIQSDGVKIFLVALIGFYCGLVYSFIIPRVWECCQVLSASMSSRLGTMSHFRSPSSPVHGNISPRYLDIWRQLKCMAYQPLQKNTHS